MNKFLVTEYPKQIYNHFNSWDFEFPPLCTDDDIIVADNCFNITPIPRVNIRVSVLAKNSERSIINAKAKYFNLRKFKGIKAIIYCLVDPFNNTPFYIGSTKLALSITLKRHIKGVNGNPEKNAFIKNILAKRKRPLIVELCKCPIEVQFVEEYRWIKGALLKYKLINTRHN